MENLKIENLVSADIRVSNAADSARSLNITAMARVENGSVGNVTQGSVSRAAEGEPAAFVASFDSYSPDTLNVQFQTDADRCTVLSDISAFIADCRSGLAGIEVSMTGEDGGL